MEEGIVQQKVIPNGRPYLDDTDKEAMQRVIASGWIADGDEITCFESEFAAFVGGKGGVAASPPKEEISPRTRRYASVAQVEHTIRSSM